MKLRGLIIETYYLHSDDEMGLDWAGLDISILSFSSHLGR